MRRADFYVDPISWSKAHGCTMSKDQRQDVRTVVQTTLFLFFILYNIMYDAGSKEYWDGCPPSEAEKEEQEED